MVKTIAWAPDGRCVSLGITTGAILNVRPSRGAVQNITDALARPHELWSNVTLFVPPVGPNGLSDVRDHAADSATPGTSRAPASAGAAGVTNTGGDSAEPEDTGANGDTDGSGRIGGRDHKGG